MEAYTEQSAFTKAYLGLKSQGFLESYIRHGKGSIKDVSCAYRGDECRKCAIGHLIPDNLYSVSMEYTPAITVCQRPELSPLFGNLKFAFLKDLQNCHDNATSPESMKTRLQDFAKRYSLEVPTDS